MSQLPGVSKTIQIHTHTAEGGVIVVYALREDSSIWQKKFYPNSTVMQDWTRIDNK